MSVLHFLYSLLGAVILAGVILLLIRQAFVPSAFEDLKSDFGKVLDGRISHSTFVSLFMASHGAPQITDNQANAEFKALLPTILDDEAFLRRALSNSNISYAHFMKLWMGRDLTPPTPGDNNIAKTLDLSFSPTDQRARGILDKLVERGFCAPDSYLWIYDGTGKSRLMGLFADAIHQESHGKIKFDDLNKLWGVKNISDLKKRAQESTHYERYLGTVRTIFPDYNPVIRF